jgi:hypothetical protein
MITCSKAVPYYHRLPLRVLELVLERPCGYLHIVAGSCQRTLEPPAMFSNHKPLRASGVELLWC